VPTLWLTSADKSNVCLMYECCCLKCLPRVLVAQATRSQLSELVVDEREKVVRGLSVPGRGCIEQLSDVRHIAEHIRVRRGPQPTAPVGGPNQALFRIRAKDGTKFSITMGGVNSLPYAGDWDGNGKDKIGTYSKTLARFLLRNTNY